MTEAVLALILVAVSHALRVRFGWNFGDEGFLWNGAVRIGQGKIPIRDYKSYDPGRFYWSWAGMKLFGSGLLGLRHSAAVFQAIGLWAGLLALGTRTDSIPALALAGVVFVFWMQPRHKLYEHAMSLIVVLTLTMLIRTPLPSTALFAGIVTGFAGLMGRNHGAYAFAASVLALVLLAFKGAVGNPGSLAGFWGLGIVIGYVPMLGMFLFIPGMFRRYVHDKVLVFFRRGRSNLAQRPPWPWTIDYSGLSPLDRLSRFLTGLHFIVLPAFYAIALGWIALGPQLPENAFLVASCVVGIFYLHHASSRSDLAHLCQVMQPFLCALFAIAYSATNPLIFWLTPLVLIVVAFLVVRQIDPRLQWMKARDTYAEIDVHGDRIIAPRGQVTLVNQIRTLLDQHLDPADGLFIAPSSAMLYPILQKQTPVHSDYLLFPETEAAQDQLIADLESNGINWALTQDHALDGRDDLRFRNTHAKVWDYLETDFDRIQPNGLGKQWDLWRRKTESTES